MDISQFNFDYLHLTRGLETIQYSPDEIKKGNGRTATRKIYTGVPYDNFEKQQIKELETELIERGVALPSRWNEAETLKYLYSSQFDHEKAIKKVQDCMEWRNNPASHTLTKEVLALYESGALYIYGRDKQYRPIIVFDFGKVDFDKVKADDFNAGISMLLDILIKYCYVPAKVENIVILIDTRKLSLSKVPITPLKNWFALGNACFPNIAHKTYVLGPPFLLRMSWKLIEGLFDKETAAKIEILAADELNKMQSLIDPSQLEEKHGGSLPNLTTFWPPTSTFAAPTPSLSRKSLKSLQDIQEMSNESPHSFIGRQPANLPSHNFYHSLPVSQNRIEEERRSPTPKNLLDTPQGRSSRNQIFDSKANRSSFRGSHSPMRVREGDEHLINDILSSRITPTVPNFNLARASAAPSQIPTHNYIESSPSYLSSNTPMERVKKSALPPGDSDRSYLSPSKRQHIGGSSVLQPIEETVPYLQTGNQLMDMILKEDKYLKTVDPYQHRFNFDRGEPAYVPDEFTQVDQLLGGRRTAEARLKQHVDVTHSPENRRYTTRADYGYERPYEDLTQKVLEPRYPNRQETQKNSRPIQRHASDWSSEGLKAHESSFGSMQSLNRRDMSKNYQNDYNNESVEDWSQRKQRVLPKGYEEEDSEEEETNFCGLCVSKRKKGSTKKH